MSTPSTFKIKGAFTFVASRVLFPSACWWAETLAVPKFDAEIEIVERGRLLDSEGPKGGDEIVIITVESVFTPRAGSRLASRDIDNFELVFSRLTACLKETRFRQKFTKHSATLICWSLYDRDKPCRPQMNRWVLPVPQNPIKNSIESLEMVLYNFVCLSQLKVNNSHSLCPKGAILDCNEAQLHQLSEKNALLDRLIEDFRHRYPTHDNAIIQTLIKEKIATVESTVTCLLTLVSFIENNYGRATPAQGVWNKVKSFIRGPFTTLAIDNPQLEIIKDNIRREMTALQRAAPILAAHIRLLDPDARKDFFGALKDAGDVAMKHEMLRKLAIVPQYLNDAEKRVDHMRRVKEYYDKVAARLLAEIEALNKLVGEEYMLHGDAMFNLQGPLGRFGGRKPRVNTRCAVEDCYPRCSLDWSEDWSEKI